TGHWAGGGGSMGNLSPVGPGRWPPRRPTSTRCVRWWSEPMYGVTRLLDVVPEHRDRVVTALRQAATASGARRWVVERTDPRSRNGGDILLHLRFPDADRWSGHAPRFDELLADTAITRVNGACYQGTPVSTGQPGTVYRTLLL